MQDNIYIEEYTPKSFVVRGETRECKDSLKAMGGKWNNGLTDKTTGEKFGAWIFWSDKLQEVKKWIKSGCDEVIYEKPSESLLDRLVRLERRVAQLEKSAPYTRDSPRVAPPPGDFSTPRRTPLTVDVDDDFEIESNQLVPPRRLLGTTKVNK
jgi:hypothetical protein